MKIFRICSQQFENVRIQVYGDEVCEKTSYGDKVARTLLLTQLCTKWGEHNVLKVESFVPTMLSLLF